MNLLNVSVFVAAFAVGCLLVHVVPGRRKNGPAIDDTQAIPAVDLPSVFEAGRVELVHLIPASPLAPPAVERWVHIRDYLIDDAEMRALVEPLYQGPPDN